jgi:site-specific recombinase XerD
VGHFVGFLRDRGVVQSWGEPPTPSTEKDCRLQSFAAHLDLTKGLCPGTRRIYVRYAGAFLEQVFSDGALDWQRVEADDITKFVRVQAARLTPSACRGPITALRSFLRYLILVGAIRQDLLGAVPTVRQWKHAVLPGYLSLAQVETVLACFADDTAVHRRDRAIILLLARLGMRASEVAGLCLDDVDWREGLVNVRAGKSKHPRALPLPHDVGEALAIHVKARLGGDNGRRREVFLRAVPPEGPMSAGAVTCVAARALRRAGIDVPRAGAHVFRRTAATWMVRRGATFKEVADVLGHARLETTAIYAKLDLRALLDVALPWPGGE